MGQVLKVTDAGGGQSVVHVAVDIDHVWTVTVPTYIAVGDQLDVIAEHAQRSYDRRQRLLKGDGT